MHGFYYVVNTFLYNEAMFVGPVFQINVLSSTTFFPKSVGTWALGVNKSIHCGEGKGSCELGRLSGLLIEKPPH